MRKLHPLQRNIQKIKWEKNNPFNTDFKDKFFQPNVIDETNDVFINANELNQRWQQLNKDHFRIGELGFGFGLNFLITIASWFKSNAQNKKWLDYISIDSFDFNIDDFNKVIKNYPEIKDFADEFIKFLPITNRGYTRINLSKYKVRLTLIMDDVDDALSSLLKNPNNQIDAWYLDGFDPKNNKSMWSKSVINKISMLSKKDTTFGTYTAAGFVRRELEKNNFEVNKVKGFGNKRHKLIGKYKGSFSDSAPKSSGLRVAIIGAGLSGTCLSYKLANQGVKVDLFEKNNRLDLNPLGSMYPKFSLDVDARSYLLTQAYFYSHNFYSSKYEGYMNTGIIFLNNSADRKLWIDRLLKLGRNDLFELLTAKEINYQNTIDQPYDGLMVKIGGCVSIKDLSNQMLRNKNISLHNGYHFSDYKIGKNISLNFNNGKKYDGYSHLIFCSGSSLQSLMPKIGIKHGAIVGIKNKNLEKINSTINSNGYVLPKYSNLNWSGSIYSNQEIQINNRAFFKEIMKKNNNLLKDVYPEDVNASWSGARATLPDYMPVAGSVDKQKVFVLGGLGSRGLSLAPLLAEMIMGDICGITSPVSNEIREAIDPKRFLVK